MWIRSGREIPGVAKLPVMNVDDYVFSYANIRYEQLRSFSD